MEGISSSLSNPLLGRILYRPQLFTASLFPSSSDPQYQHSVIARDFEHETGDHGWGNEELQNYVRPGEGNVEVVPIIDQTDEREGEVQNALILRAQVSSSDSTDGATSRFFRSARLRGLIPLGFSRGYLEGRFTVPIAKGIWPAFWLLPCPPFVWPGEGEVDILETWNATSENCTCFHWGHFTKEHSARHKVLRQRLGRRIFEKEEGSRFGLAWNATTHGEGARLIWFIEGEPVMRARLPSPDEGGDELRPLDQYVIMLNIAMGGNVQGGTVPEEGTYEFKVHDLFIAERPPIRGGWEAFDEAWQNAPEGEGM